MKNKSYDKKIFRLIYILNKLNSKQLCKTTELANEFNVTARTTQRDLELLNSSGFPLVYDGGSYKFMDGFSLQKIAVTPQEKFLLNTFYGLFSKAGSPFNSITKNFLNKVLFVSRAIKPEPDKKFTIREKKIIQEEIKGLSRSLPVKLEDLSYPPNFIKKIQEFLNEIEEKINRLKKEQKVDIKFRRCKLVDRGKPVAIISVPKKYFHDPYKKLDFCTFEKNRNFEIRSLLPCKIYQGFRMEIRIEMTFNFFGPHLKSKQLTCFDDFASYLGFGTERKEFSYNSSYGNDKGVLLTRGFIHWEKEISMPKKDIKPFFNKAGGFIIYKQPKRKNKSS